MMGIVLVVLMIMTVLFGCSSRRIAVQATLSLVSSQIVSMQEEADDGLEEKAIPASCKFVGQLKNVSIFAFCFNFST